MSKAHNAAVHVDQGSLSVLAVAIRWILASATLSALVLILSVTSWAQSQQSAPPIAAPASETAEKGLNTSIKIHGHWTVEVRNPDGRLVTHREFENCLQGPTCSFTNNGAGVLAGILGRVLIPGGWALLLLNEANGLGGEIAVTESSATGPAYCTSLSKQTSPVSCSNNLVLTPPSASNGTVISGTTLTLTGSGIVPQGFLTQIGAVETVQIVCTASESPSACTADGPNSGPNSLTGRILDGVGGDPSPVPVTQGQTVSVTVVLSFQ